jgi:dihydroneopterin triphosphate diphosphatase
MPRAPFNVLVIPYQQVGESWHFAVLHRADADMWQFVAGGGEDDESPVETARRELFEETGIDHGLGLIELDSIASVPRTAFPGAPWPDSVLVIPQYSFAADTSDGALRLSSEHDAIEWLGYDEARRRLTWDSNRVALWELQERLKRAV